MLRPIALLALVALTGCAATYTLEGEKVGGATEFLSKIDAQNEADIANVAPLPRPVTSRSLVFAIPSRDALMALSIANFEKAQGRKPSGQAEEMVSTLTTGNYRLMRVFGHAVSKRGIYPSLRMVDLDTTTPSVPIATAEEDVLYYFESGPSTAGWFYVTKTGGRQVFAFDRSLPGSKAKVAAFLDAVQANVVKH